MRTVYWLTEHGREALNHWLDEPEPSASTRHIRTEFLSRLYIARLLDRPLTPIIDAQRAACVAHLESLTEARSACPPGATWLSLELRVRELDLIIDWLGLCEPMFRHGTSGTEAST
jgi:hypothetical protein